jgi:hypothetical protein
MGTPPTCCDACCHAYDEATRVGAQALIIAPGIG